MLFHHSILVYDSTFSSSSRHHTVRQSAVSISNALLLWIIGNYILLLHYVIYITYCLAVLEIMLFCIWSDTCSVNSWLLPYLQPYWAFFINLDANLSSVYLQSHCIKLLWHLLYSHLQENIQDIDEKACYIKNITSLQNTICWFSAGSSKHIRPFSRKLYF